MVRATRVSYPAGRTSSSTGSPYCARLAWTTMDGSWLLAAMTGSRPASVMVGSRLSVRIRMGSVAGTATTQRMAPTSTAAVLIGGDARAAA